MYVVGIIALFGAAHIPQVFAATITWDGGGGDNNWSTCANWSSDTCPGSSDVATFNATSVKDATIDASFAGSLQGFSIASGYTGVIAQARDLTIGSAGFSQADGTFQQATYGFLFTTTSAFTFSGGILNSGVGSTTVLGNVTFSGGTYNASSTRVIRVIGGTGQNTTFTCTGTLPGLITIGKTNAGAFALAAGCVATTTDNNTSSSSGAVTVSGTLNLAGATATLGGLTINSGGTVNFPNGTSLILSTSGFILNAGSVLSYPAASTSVIGNVTISPSATFDDASNGILTIIGGTGQNTTFTCTGTYAGLINIAKTNSGFFTLASGCVARLGVNHTNAGAAVAINGTLDLNGFNFPHSGGFTLGATGTLRLQGSETLTAPTMLWGSTVEYNGSGSYTSLKLGGTYSNLSFTGSGTWATSSAISLTHNFNQTSGTFTHTGTLSFTGTSTMVATTSSGTNLTNVTLNGSGLTVTLAGSGLALGGNLTLTSGTLDASTDKCSGGSCPITLAGSWSNAGTFTPRTGTVTFNGTSQSITGATTFYNLTKSTGTTDTLTFPAGVTETITNTLTLTGASDNLLSLRSSSDGVQWQIDPQGTRTLSYLNVKDSNNVNATAISAGGLNITNALNNTNWSFSVAPGVPSSLGPAALVNGSALASTTPTFTFTTSDTDGDPTRFEFDLDDSADFASPIVQYLSAYAAPGSSSFRVGQAVGSGVYVVGSQGQTLSDGSYYWRVRAGDGTATSTYATANSGAVAFIVDTVAPTPGTVSTTSVGATSITASTTAASGAATYTFTDSLTSDTSGATTSTYWIHSSLSPNTEHSYTVTVTDAAGNASTSAALVVYTLANPPSALVLNADSSSAITASWQANGNPGGTEYFAENVTAGTNSGWITATTWQSTGLSAAETYTIRVKARNADDIETTTIDDTQATPDTAAPVITLIGAASMTLTEGDTYSEPGATAVDDVDGDVSADIIIAGSVNTAVPGTYQLTYNVSDSSGNDAVEATRTVTVNAVAASEPERRRESRTSIRRYGCKNPYALNYDAFVAHDPTLCRYGNAPATTLPIGGGVGAPSISAFTRDLTLGMTGEDVRALQIYLNAKGFLVATEGPGSPGNETLYFGLLTRTAVARLQAAKGIVPAVGYFGPITRSFIRSGL